MSAIEGVDDGAARFQAEGDSELEDDGGLGRCDGLGCGGRHGRPTVVQPVQSAQWCFAREFLQRCTFSGRPQGREPRESAASAVLKFRNGTREMRVDLARLDPKMLGKSSMICIFPLRRLVALPQFVIALRPPVMAADMLEVLL